MGLLSSIESMIGGDTLQRMAGGNANFSAGSPDHQHLQNMISHAPPDLLQNIFGQVAGQMNNQQYASHINPGSPQATPLSNLGGGALSTIASMLLGNLMNSGGYSAQSLLNRIPGLQTTDPQQMDPAQVASVASYTQQNHPDIFGRVAAALGQQHPGLLQHFLGSGGLSKVAQLLAGHALGQE